MNANKIYRDAVRKLEGNEITLGEFNEMVKQLEDVKPVVHGYYNNKGCCSVCGSYIPTDHRLDCIDKSDVRYCYYCGAKMDGESEVEK